ncbi:MAG: zinc ribbon domain-containing protein [Nitrospirota bacterium]|nr:zinc ribbon domain-containing protein [Nitrospirota bacterium]
MPVYEYVCLKCNEKFALLQSLYPRDNNTECPKCSSRDVKKLLSSFSCSQGEHTSASSAPAPRFGGGGG